MSEENGTKKPTVAYCDGCFDFLHYGHANQIRQAKQISDVLVVGIHSDAAIAKHKCAPVFLENERYHMLSGLKWVDKIIFDAPFSPTVKLLDDNSCNFCVHGNDFSLTHDGDHTYGEVQRAGRYVERKRMSGVSTTDLIERILYLSDERNNNNKNALNNVDSPLVSYGLNLSPWTRGYRFLPSSQLLKHFSEGGRDPLPTDKVVYVAGTFDVFHVGHLSFLEEAAKLGTYLLVGVHADSIVKDYKDCKHFPILSIHERVLNVLSYKCVSNVLIGAPYVVSAELMDEYKVDLVCHGLRVPVDQRKGVDPYIEPKKRGKFCLIDSMCSVTTDTIFERVLNRNPIMFFAQFRLELEQRNRKKETKERNAYDKVMNGMGDQTKMKQLIS